MRRDECQVSSEKWRTEDVKKKVTLLTLCTRFFALSARHFAIWLLGALFLGLNLPARAQQPKKIPRLGILSLGGPGPSIDAFLKGLHELGWVEGKDIAIEYGWAKGNEDRVRALAA